tara:strand:+ start:1220 stop:1711 length:492 start_codon:yes stop_codon:yes gene_type:complete
MKIGVVSDTHNNLKNIETIIKLFNDEKVSLVIHTGDIANAKSLEKFSKLNCELIGVYGNNDRSELGITEVALRNNFNFQQPPRKLTLNRREIAIFHEPDHIEKFLLENKGINVILYGHTHRYENNIKNEVLYFNPGESAGMQRGRNAVGILDLSILKAKRIFF